MPHGHPLIPAPAAPAAASVLLGELSPGRRGTAETVAIMADLSAGPWGAQSPRIRDLALAIVRAAGIDAKDYRGEVDAIHAWMQAAIRYTRDPVGQERVQTPEYTAFAARAGDCDDFAVLETALLGALGHRTRFVTIGFTPQRFSHVYAEVELRGAWLPLDAITDHAAGWEAGGAAVRTTWPINRPGGFDAAAAARERGLGAWYNPLSWFGSDPPPPSPYGPLPDPEWILAHRGASAADALLSGSAQPGWNQATSEQRSGYLKAFMRMNRVRGEQIERTVARLDAAQRVATGVATLGTSELVRAWNEATAKAKQYGALRTQALTRAAALDATRPDAARAIRQAVAEGDARVLAAMGPLRPFLAADAGLGVLPAVAYALGAGAIVAVVVAIGWAIGRVGDAVRATGDAMESTGRGVQSAAPVLIIGLGVLGLWLWMSHRRSAGATTTTTRAARPGLATRLARAARRAWA